MKKKIKVKKLLPGGLLTPAMRVMVKSARNLGIKKTPEVAKEEFDMIDTARSIVQKSKSKINNQEIDTSFLSDKDEVFKEVAKGLAKQKKASLYQKLSDKAIESPQVKESLKESLRETAPKLKEYKQSVGEKIKAVMEKDIFKPTMQKEGGLIQGFPKLAKKGWK